MTMNLEMSDIILADFCIPFLRKECLFCYPGYIIIAVIDSFIFITSDYEKLLMQPKTRGYANFTIMTKKN